MGSAPPENVEFAFQWHLTNRCPGRCRHCYQSSFGQEGEASGDDFARILESLSRGLDGSRYAVNLTGGEPFAWPSLVEVVRWLDEQAGCVRADIITSGRGATRQKLSSLAASKKVRALRLSVDAADSTTNDGIRGRGAFAAAMRAAELAREQGLRVILMVTLARYNLSQLGPLAELAEKSGFDGVIVERMVPIGRGESERSQVLGATEWLEVLGVLAGIAGGGIQADDLIGLHAFWISMDGENIELRAAECNLGASSMALMPDGSVQPCRRLPVVVGNLANEPLWLIRRRLESFSPARVKTELSGPVCSACPLDYCAGCRAMARAVNGNWLADDPCCPLGILPEGTG